MEKIWITLALIALAQGTSNLRNQPLKIGQACDGYAPFNISTFNISPWPPVFNHPMTISFQGVFQMSVQVAYLATGESCNYQNWEYTQYPINQNFTAGQSKTFTQQLSSGSTKGNCYLQVTLHGAPPEDLFITCWEVNYQLN